MKIPKGAVVIPVLANGNLDSKKFEGPETFVLGRPNANQHLTFGKGIHTCIGAPLARREMQLTFEHAIKTIKSITGSLTTTDSAYRRIHERIWV